MEFILLGFDQSASTRRFRFEIIGADRSRTPVVVVADLSLAREYDIQVQNLPLACRELLAHSDATTLASGLVTLTEGHMAELRKSAADAREQAKPRKVRQKLSSEAGKAWRAALPFGIAPKSH